MSSSSSSPFHNWQITGIKRGMMTEKPHNECLAGVDYQRVRLRIIAGTRISARMIGRIDQKNRLSFSKCQADQ
jgi:hypothetical protein